MTSALGKLPTYDELLDAGFYEPDAEECNDRATPPDLPVSGRRTPASEPEKRRTSWTADELMRTVFPPTRWAVPGLVAEGVNLLVAPPKAGKSWLALGIAAAIAAGGRALSTIPVEEGDVLYLALEDTGRRLQSRLTSVLAGDTATARLHLATECAALPDGGASRIADWLYTHPDARLVIVDVFTKVRGASNAKSGQYEQDYAAMSALKDLADTYGVAFIVVHHTRKAESTDFIDAVSGTQGLAGAADAILVLARSRGNADAVLKVTGRDIEEAEYALDFDAPTGTWKLLDGPASDYELSDTRRRILELLRTDGAMTPKHVADALDIPHETAKKTCRRMSETGQIDTDGSGTYSAPMSPVPHVPGVPEEGTSDPMSPVPGVPGVPDGDKRDARDTPDMSPKSDAGTGVTPPAMSLLDEVTP